jgi:hypothetical protein
MTGLVTIFNSGDLVLRKKYSAACNVLSSRTPIRDPVKYVPELPFLLKVSQFSSYQDDINDICYIVSERKVGNLGTCTFTAKGLKLYIPGCYVSPNYRIESK